MNRGLSAWIAEASEKVPPSTGGAWRRLELERQRLLQQLETTLAELERLKGLLTVCSNCRRIQNEYGSWEPLEAFIERRSRAQFTHGLCMECAHRLYPDLDLGQEEEVQHETSSAQPGD